MVYNTLQRQRGIQILSVLVVRRRIGFNIPGSYIKKRFSTSIVGSRMVIDFNAGTTFNPADITIDLSRTIIFLIII